MKYSVSILIVVSAVCYSSVLFSDDFEDGNADGWTQFSTGATYFVSDGWYQMVNSQAEDCSVGAYNGDQAGSMSVADYSLLTEIYPRQGDSGPVVRYDDASSTGYWFVINPEFDGVALVRMSASGSPEILAIEYITLSYLEYYWARIEVSGSLLGGKLWQGSPGDEPEEWLITASDATITSPGSICLYAHNSNPGGTASVHNDYDNIEVSDDLTLALSGVTWGSIKALL